MFITGLVPSGALPELSPQQKAVWDMIPTNSTDQLAVRIKALDESETVSLAKRIANQALLIKWLRKRDLPTCTPYLCDLFRHASRCELEDSVSQLAAACIKNYPLILSFTCFSDHLDEWKQGGGTTTGFDPNLTYLPKRTDPIYGSLADRIRRIFMFAANHDHQSGHRIEIFGRRLRFPVTVYQEDMGYIKRYFSHLEDDEKLVELILSRKRIAEFASLGVFMPFFTNPEKHMLLSTTSIFFSFLAEPGGVLAKLDRQLSVSEPKAIKCVLLDNSNRLSALKTRMESTLDLTFPADIIPSVYSEGEVACIDTYYAWIVLAYAKLLDDARLTEQLYSDSSVLTDFKSKRHLYLMCALLSRLDGQVTHIEKKDKAIDVFRRMCGTSPNLLVSEQPSTSEVDFDKVIIDAMAQKARHLYYFPLENPVAGRATLFNLKILTDDERIAPCLAELIIRAWNRYIKYISDDVALKKGDETLAISNDAEVPLLAYLAFMTKKPSSIKNIAFGEKKISAKEVRKEIKFLLKDMRLSTTPNEKAWTYFTEVYPDRTFKDWLTT